MKNKIKYYRDMQNMSQEELAEKANVSRTIISGLENETVKVVKTDTLEKISKALGVGLVEIFFSNIVQ